MNELALFAGVGGGILGGKLLGWTTKCYVENNAYCVEVIKARIRDGYLDNAPIWGDIRTFDGRPWAGLVDIITAGFPCQPFSVAGKRKGAGDSRNMWPETIRIIREVRPRYALCENVPGLISGDHGYFGRILNDLSQSGYDARWRIVSAADVGAPHLRKRLWILAESSSAAARLEKYRSGGQEREYATAPESTFLRQEYRACGTERIGTGSDDVADSHSNREMPIQQQGQRHGSIQESPSMADANGTATRQEKRGGMAKADRVQAIHRQNESISRLPGRTDRNVPNADNAGCGAERIAVHTQTEHAAAQRCSWWDNDPAEDATESQVGRVAHGIPDRIQQLRALGNAQVPGVAKLAWELLSDFRYIIR